MDSEDKKCIAYDIFSIIFNNLSLKQISIFFSYFTLKQIFSLKLISKSFNEAINKIFSDDTKKFSKHMGTFDWMLNIFWSDEDIDYIPFVFNNKLLCHNYDKEGYHGTYEYITNSRIIKKCLTTRDISNIDPNDLNNPIKKIANDYFMLSIEGNELIERKLIVPNNFLFDKILFDGAYYILVKHNKQVGIYKKFNDQLVLCITLDTKYVYIDEEKNYLIYLTQDNKIILENLSNFDETILNEEFISNERKYRYVKENRYLISKTTNGMIIFRMMYFDGKCKIYEVRTREFDYNWKKYDCRKTCFIIATFNIRIPQGESATYISSEHGQEYDHQYKIIDKDDEMNKKITIIYDLSDYYISYSINLGIIYLAGTHNYIIYSIKFDKIIDLYERDHDETGTDGDDVVEISDFNQHTYGFTYDHNYRHDHDGHFKCRKINSQQ
jgi:hypothetical protein